MRDPFRTPSLAFRTRRVAGQGTAAARCKIVPSCANHPMPCSYFLFLIRGSAWTQPIASAAQRLHTSPETGGEQTRRLSQRKTHALTYIAIRTSTLALAPHTQARDSTNSSGEESSHFFLIAFSACKAQYHATTGFVVQVACHSHSRTRGCPRERLPRRSTRPCAPCSPRRPGRKTLAPGAQRAGGRC